MANKKNKRTGKEKKGFKISKNLKIAIISIAAIVVIAISVTTTVSVIKKKKAEKTVSIAFYGLSENYVNLLQEFIPKEEKIILKCDVLSEGSIDLGALKNKYDMLFTWKGEITDSLEASSENIPPRILDTIASSLRNNKCIPILLDHYELDYSLEVINQIDRDIPNSYPGFLNYLNQSKNYVFSPFFCPGSNDRTLAAFVGAIIQANGGEGVYKKFIEELKNDTPFENLLDVNLGNNITLRSVLDSLKSWPEEGYCHPLWYNANSSDLLYFTESNQVGVFFTNLQEHREIPYKVITRYESYVLPPASSTIKFGIIAPSICGMLISDNSNAKRYLAEFFTADAQELLSENTRLAPTHLRAQPCDRQADDVRYWAASCPAGALPDLSLAAFQRKPEKLKTFTDSIRNYIRNN